MTAFKQEYLTKYSDLIIQETSLEAHIRDVINRFVRTGSVNKRKSLGKPSVIEQVVDNETTSAESVSIFDKIVSAVRSSYYNMKLDNGF